MQSKELSKRLGINLAKWKRWAREFLPPDSKAGLQSGYAREYTKDEAFRVYLAGYLVSRLNFSIPETREILEELEGWLKHNGFFPSSLGSRRDVTVFIWEDANGKYRFVIKRSDPNARDVQRLNSGLLISERFELISFRSDQRNQIPYDPIIGADVLYCLNPGLVLGRFLQSVGG